MHVIAALGSFGIDAPGKLRHILLLPCWYAHAACTSFSLSSYIQHRYGPNFKLLGTKRIVFNV